MDSGIKEAIKWIKEASEWSQESQDRITSMEIAIGLWKGTVFAARKALALLTAEPEPSVPVGVVFAPTSAVGEFVKPSDPEPCPVHAEPEFTTHPGGYSGGEPEPCEDAFEVARSILLKYRTHRDYDVTEASKEIAAYASQVADKRAEELCKVIKEAISFLRLSGYDKTYREIHMLDRLEETLAMEPKP